MRHAKMSFPFHHRFTRRQNVSKGHQKAPDFPGDAAHRCPKGPLIEDAEKDKKKDKKTKDKNTVFSLETPRIHGSN